MKDDYLVTFYNYYGIKPGDEKCDIIVKALLDAELSYVLKTDDPKTADLEKELREYLSEIGRLAGPLVFNLKSQPMDGIIS